MYWLWQATSRIMLGIKNNNGMVEVFKTNVPEQVKANELKTLLLQHFPQFRINIELDDCDKVLRVEGTNIAQHKIIELVTLRGYHCEVLE